MGYDQEDIGKVKEFRDRMSGVRNSWDWDLAMHRQYWNDPSVEAYYYAHKWKREGRIRLLDLGCGLGRHSILFARYGFEVTAMDSSEKAVGYVSNESGLLDLDIRCDIGDMHDLPYDDDSFDCIFAYLSISHTDSKGIRRILQGIRRVLAKYGAVFMTLCSKDTWSFTQSGYPRIDENSIMKTEGAEAGLPHFYVDKDDIIKLMEGFELLNVRHIDDCFYQGEWRNSKHYFIEAINRKRSDRRPNDGDHRSDESSGRNIPSTSMSMNMLAFSYHLRAVSSDCSTPIPSRYISPSLTCASQLP